MAQIDRSANDHASASQGSFIDLVFSSANTRRSPATTLVDIEIRIVRLSVAQQVRRSCGATNGERCVEDSTREESASEGPHPATRSNWTARGVSSRGIDVAGQKQIGSDVRGMAMRQASCRGGEKSARKLV